MEQLQKQLRKIRLARGLSQNALATKTGVAATKISGYERGARKPATASLVKLADGLCCSVDALLGRTVPKWPT